MRKILLSLILGFAGMLLSLPTFGQYEQDIISIGERQLTVREAYKVDELPTTKDTVVVLDTLKYSVVSKLAPTEITLDDIKAAKVKVAQPLKRLYRGYVKGGIGTYTTPIFDFHVNSLRSRDWVYGLSGNYMSSNGGISLYAPSGYSEMDIDLWAKKALRRHTLSAGLSYEGDKFHYYGFMPFLQEIDESDIEHKLQTIGFNTVLKSYIKDSTSIHHEVALSYRNSADNNDVREGNFRLVGDLSTYKSDFKFAVKTILDVNNYSSVPNKPFEYMNEDFENITVKDRDNNTILEFAPQINAVVGEFRANAGLGIAFDIDNSTAVRIMPRGFLKYSLYDNQFSLYAGIDSRLDRNSYYSNFQDNPFIYSSVQMKNTFTKLDFYGGIRGSINSELSFNVKGSSQVFSDMPFYLNSDTSISTENRFEILYDDGTYSTLLGEFTYKQSRKLTVNGSLLIGGYSLENFEKPWHRPTRVLTLGATYNLMDKFLVSTEIFSNGKTFAQTFSDPLHFGPKTIEVKGFIDANLKVEYRYTKRVSAFVQFNNLAAQRYMRWHNYPVQRLMILGGLTYSF